MATAGLSLVGFMDQPQALNYLRTVCVPNDPSDMALISEWDTARARLGAPIQNAGNPDIQPIPGEHDQYIQNLVAAWSVLGVPLLPATGITFNMIEIDPLLAYQFSIDAIRSGHHCGGLTTAPAINDLLPICLPQNQIPEGIQIWMQDHSAILKSHNLNVQTLNRGVMNGSFMGIQFGPSLPFAHVVRFNNKCYLHNGFHRALGIRNSGATHMPCILRDVQDYASVGIKQPESTFQPTLLESNDPPTLAHYTQGRALDVMLRSFSRILHVSWSEYAIPNE